MVAIRYSPARTDAGPLDLLKTTPRGEQRLLIEILQGDLTGAGGRPE
jgi:hypothetical protein